MKKKTFLSLDSQDAFNYFIDKKLEEWEEGDSAPIGHIKAWALSGVIIGPSSAYIKDASCSLIPNAKEYLTSLFTRGHFILSKTEMAEMLEWEKRYVQAS